MEELKPCPFCGTKEIEVVTTNNDVLVGCTKCGVYYDSFDNLDPIKSWNKRAKPCQ